MIPTPVWAVLAGLLGLAVGSFLNVVIYRVPAGVSVVSPPSACPRCATPIRNRHNVPVLGWLVLRGRCADCGEPISARYPLVEATTGALFALVAARLLDLDRGASVAAYLALVAGGVALAMIDLDHQRLPNAVLAPTTVIVTALLVLASAIAGDWWPLVRGAIGAVVLFGFYFALVVAYPKGMGLGDVKLAVVVGLALGYLSWSALVVGGFGAFVLGAVVGVTLMATGRAGRSSAIPFGPFMIAAALLALFFAAPIGAAWTSLVTSAG